MGSSSWWHAKKKFYQSNFSLWHFIQNGCFNSYFTTHELCCISFCIRYDFTTNSMLSSQQSALQLYLTQDHLKLSSCTNAYLEKGPTLKNLQFKQGKWLVKLSSSSVNGYPGLQAHCRVDYTVWLPFTRAGANSLLYNPWTLLQTKHLEEIRGCFSMCYFMNSWPKRWGAGMLHALLLHLFGVRLSRGLTGIIFFNATLLAAIRK